MGPRGAPSLNQPRNVLFDILDPFLEQRLHLSLRAFEAESKAVESLAPWCQKLVIFIDDLDVAAKMGPDFQVTDLQLACEKDSSLKVTSCRPE